MTKKKRQNKQQKNKTSERQMAGLMFSGYRELMASEEKSTRRNLGAISEKSDRNSMGESYSSRPALI